jgi:succinoglycan biosynthesis transport protein ExoP
MDSHDLPRSLLPARFPSSRPLPGLTARPASGVPDVAPSPQILRVTARGARRYWWLVLGLWLLGTGGLASAIYLKVQPLYESESYLRVDDKQSGLLEPGRQENYQQFLDTLVQLIKSSNVLDLAAKDPVVASLPRIQNCGDPILELRKLINVRTLPGTYLISVSMASANKDEAAIVVNAVVSAFLAVNNEWSEGLVTAQVRNLEDYLQTLKDQSSALAIRWKELASKGNIGPQVFIDRKPKADAAEGPAAPGQPLLSRTTITVEESREVQRKLFQANVDLAQALAWVEEVQNSKKVPQATATDKAAVDEQVKRRFQADPEVVELGYQLLAAQDKLKGFLRLTRDAGDPAVRKGREALARLTDRYDRMWESKSLAIREAIQANGADPNKELRDAQSKVKSLQISKATLEAHMKELRVENSRQASDDVETTLIREEHETLKDMQNAVNRKLEDLKYSKKEGARIRLTNKAVPAGRPVSDNRLKYLAVTPVGVLMAALALAVLLELRSGRVSDPDLLSSRVRHEVFPIAPLPNIRPGDDARSGRSEQKLARFVQSLDHLRVALCDGGIPGEGRCVLITSATGGEGKTTLSAHLAARCANAGTSTLLIDADLRRASLGRLLDVPTGPGLADVMDGEIGLEEALITVQAGGFHFLSAGTPGRDPARVLTSSRLASLIETLRATYDLVLIDSPPILPVPDALLMGRHVDGVVMASRFDASRLPLVERASRQLAAANIPVLGVVVNGARARSAEYGQYNYAYQYPNRNEESRSEPEMSA